jgi:hypothetical protein
VSPAVGMIGAAIVSSYLLGRDAEFETAYPCSWRGVGARAGRLTAAGRTAKVSRCLYAMVDSNSSDISAIDVSAMAKAV